MSPEFAFDLTLYPDPLLRRVAEPVAAFDAELEQTVRAMFARMYASKGVGLAAPQVGLRRRILVVNPTAAPEDELILVNPVVLERSGSLSTYEEGCLSFPGIYAEVTRPDRCRVRAADLAGRVHDHDLAGFPSRIAQHEYDHLEGVLLVDRMSPADRLRHKAALEELVERYRRSRRSAEAGRAAR